jgi:hypothetical protein
MVNDCAILIVATNAGSRATCFERCSELPALPFCLRRSEATSRPLPLHRGASASRRQVWESTRAFLVRRSSESEGGWLAVRGKRRHASVAPRQKRNHPSPFPPCDLRAFLIRYRFAI